MAINFPNSPAVNDTFTVGGISFTFTGVKWESGAVVELSSDTTPSLGGNLDGGAKNINNVGVITATGFSGSLTGNVTGNATGLTGDPSIQVTNATVLGNLDVQGTTSTIDTAITQVDSLAVEGSVGIGTDNPTNYGGAVKLALSSSGHTGLSIAAGTSSDSNIFFADGTSGDATYIGNIKYAHNDNSMRFQTAAEERLRITSSGEVVINDTAKLGDAIFGIKVNPSTHNGISFKPTSNGSFGALRTLNAAGSEVCNIQYDTTNANINFRTSNVQRLRIDSLGNIGVNQTSVNSSRKMEITQPASYSSGLRINSAGSSGNGAYFEVFVGIANYKIGGDHGTNALLFRKDGAEKLRVDNNGITATGTVSDSIGPLRRLGIHAGAGVNISLTAGHAGYLSRMTAGGTTVTVPADTLTAGDMCSVFNVSTGNISIAPAGGVTMYNSADGSTGTRTLAAKGLVTILCSGTNEFIITGTGLS